MAMTLSSRTLCTTLLTLCSTTLLNAQAQPISSTAPAQGVVIDSEVVAHHLFFHNLAILSRKADELDRANGAGAGLRRAFTAKTGLTAQDATTLLSISVALDKQLAVLDQTAAAIIAAAKKKHEIRLRALSSRISAGVGAAANGTDQSCDLFIVSKTEPYGFYSDRRICSCDRFTGHVGYTVMSLPSISAVQLGRDNS